MSSGASPSLWDKLNTVAQTVVAVVACVGIYLSLDQAKVTRQQLQLEQRPWVTFENESMKAAHAETPALVYFDLTNAGHSAMQDITLTTYFGFVDASVTEEGRRRNFEAVLQAPAHDSAVQNLGSLAPTEKLYRYVGIPPLALPAEKAARQGSGEEVLIGLVQYEDIFRSHHVMHFCLILPSLLSKDTDDLEDCPNGFSQN